MHSAPSGLFAQGCLADLLDRLHSPLVLAALPTSKTSFKASENVGQNLGSQLPIQPKPFWACRQSGFRQRRVHIKER